MEDYRQEFLEEIEKHKSSSSNQQQETSNSFNKQDLPFKVTNTNEIWNSTKYSDTNWRNKLNTSYYTKEHGIEHFKINQLLNPEVKTKTFNMRATQISEYSNAKHNNTVFVNPKFTSC
ncbi:hypothetical protein pb186bvf_006459 [Paramecium bursaria]